MMIFFRFEFNNTLNKRDSSALRANFVESGTFAAPKTIRIAQSALKVHNALTQGSTYLFVDLLD